MVAADRFVQKHEVVVLGRSDSDHPLLCGDRTPAVWSRDDGDLATRELERPTLFVDKRRLSRGRSMLFSRAVHSSVGKVAPAFSSQQLCHRQHTSAVDDPG
jgi:hypothetical protein